MNVKQLEEGRDLIEQINDIGRHLDNIRKVINSPSSRIAAMNNLGFLSCVDDEQLIIKAAKVLEEVYSEALQIKIDEFDAL